MRVVFVMCCVMLYGLLLCVLCVWLGVSFNVFVSFGVDLLCDVVWCVCVCMCVVCVVCSFVKCVFVCCVCDLLCDVVWCVSVCVLVCV